MTFNSEDEKTNEVKELLEKNAKHTKQLKLVLAKLDEIDKKIDAVVTAKLADEDEKAKVEKNIWEKGDWQTCRSIRNQARAICQDAERRKDKATKRTDPWILQNSKSWR